MNNKLLNYEAMKILNNRQRFAKQKAESNLAKAFKSPKFEQAYKRRLTLVPEIAQKNASHLESDDLKAQYQLLSTIINEELKKIDLTEEDITPTYYCKKCQDTGAIDGIKCQCFFDVVDALQKRELKATKVQSKGLNLIDNSIIKDAQKQTYNRLVEQLKKIVLAFPNNNKKYIIFSGATGTGKTYLAEALMCDLDCKGYFVLSLSAFALNNAFLKHHTSFDETSINILDPILNCDALLIDDLGAEPHFNNVTNEYLVSIINDRKKDGKLTIITTNLTPQTIQEKYGARVASRLSDSNIVSNIKLNFEDLRSNKAKSN